MASQLPPPGGLIGWVLDDDARVARARLVLYPICATVVAVAVCAVVVTLVVLVHAAALATGISVVAASVGVRAVRRARARTQRSPMA